ncbi:MAG TPA: hypothetical protein VFM54_24320 [Micromonosporaceae bacterium]|nr:hypothetical protein [Micromonosporaceae bacterium]
MRRSTGLAGVLAPAVPASAARLRQAVVQASPVATADTVYVRVQGGGETLALPYPAGYVPLPGDVVMVLSIGAGATETGMVVAPLAGHSGNRVLNQDFSVVSNAFDAVPDTWTHYRAAGPAAITATGELYPAFEKPSLNIEGLTALASDNWVLSAAIPVVPDERYELGYIVEMQSGTTITASLLATWYADPAHEYPTTAAADSTIGSQVLVGPALASGAGIVTVPAGVAAMRVAVRVEQSAGGTGYATHWPYVTAFRSSG